MFCYQMLLLGECQICWGKVESPPLPPTYPSPSSNMWISHLDGKRSCMRVNNSGGVSPYCPSSCCLRLSITRLCKLNAFLCASSLPSPLLSDSISAPPHTHTPPQSLATPLIRHLPYSSPHLDAHEPANGTRT